MSALSVFQPGEYNCFHNGSILVNILASSRGRANLSICKLLLNQHKAGTHIGIQDALILGANLCSPALISRIASSVLGPMLKFLP